MIENLLIGLPNDRPGGLLLTVLIALVSGLIALLAGFLYAAICVAFPRASVPLQAAGALLRGIPVLLLMFFISQMTSFPLTAAGLIALVLYSFSYVSEILRSFLAAYPRPLSEQARVIGMRKWTEWRKLRAPWTLGRALDALTTHWISLLKDTGALVVLGVGELTTIAKALSESSASSDRWFEALVLAAGMYLATTLLLIRGLQAVRNVSSIRGLT
jgi:ABC-type amino acid transport system permease subunit